jgi:hypothetical protein
LLRVELASIGQSTAPQLRDISSFIAVAWGANQELTLTLRAFPFDTDYLRVGYLHALDWGGTDAARRDSVFIAQTGGAPGLELALRAKRLQLLAAVKWANVDDAVRGSERLWGALWGGSFELHRVLRLDAGFGYFQRHREAGASSRFVEGASARLVWHGGASEPELAAEPFRPPSFRQDPEVLVAASPVGFALALEAVTLVARQRRFEDSDAETLTAAPAVALYGSARGRTVAAHLAVAWRSVAFALRNDARVGVDTTLPANAAPLAELSAWLGCSLTSLPLRLVPSIEIGARLPPALEVPSALPGYAQTLLVGGAAGFDALPIGATRLPVLATRLGARLQVSTSVGLSAFAEYERNPNRTSFAASPAGVTRRFESPDVLSVFSAAQARF